MERLVNKEAESAVKRWFEDIWVSQKDLDLFYHADALIMTANRHVIDVQVYKRFREILSSLFQFEGIDIESAQYNKRSIQAIYRMQAKCKRCNQSFESMGTLQFLEDNQKIISAIGFIDQYSFLQHLGSGDHSELYDLYRIDVQDEATV